MMIKIGVITDTLRTIAFSIDHGWIELEDAAIATETVVAWIRQANDPSLRSNPPPAGEMDIKTVDSPATQ